MLRNKIEIRFWKISRLYRVFQIPCQYKNRGFWEVLERIRALYANRNEYSQGRYIEGLTSLNVSIIKFYNFYLFHNPLKQGL